LPRAEIEQHNEIAPKQQYERIEPEAEAEEDADRLTD